MLAIVLVLVLVLVACTDRSSGVPAASQAESGMSSTVAVSSGAHETSSPAITPTVALARARQRLVTDPPTIHGIYEVREANEPQPLRWELWVRWPAFRVETTVQGERAVIATVDGKLLAYRDGDQVGTTRGLGEQGAILLTPMLQFSGLPASPCGSEQILGDEEVAGRKAIHVVCADDGSETWIDSASGLVLASVLLDAGAAGQTSAGYTSIEFDPHLGDAVFDASTV